MCNSQIILLCQDENLLKHDLFFHQKNAWIDKRRTATLDDQAVPSSEARVESNSFLRPPKESKDSRVAGDPTRRTGLHLVSISQGWGNTYGMDEFELNAKPLGQAAPARRRQVHFTYSNL